MCRGSQAGNVQVGNVVALMVIAHAFPSATDGHAMHPGFPSHSRLSTLRMLGAALALIGPACAPATTTVRTASRAEVQDFQADAKAAVAAERELDVARIPASTIAVVPFDAADSATDALGYGLAELVAADLARFKGLELVERGRISALLHELDLADSGRVDPATAPRVGRLVGARRLVFGTLTSEADTALTFAVGIADAVTGQATSGVTGWTQANRLFEAEQAIVLKLAVALGVEVPPDLDAKMRQRSGYPPAAFVAYSAGARAESHSDLSAAEEAYGMASTLAPAFDEASTKRTAMRERLAHRTSREPVHRVPPRRRPARTSPSLAAPVSAIARP